jgi:hypothetical protein
LKLYYLPNFKLKEIIKLTVQVIKVSRSFTLTHREEEEEELQNSSLKVLQVKIGF